ncbi:MarR family winged helix-turn-helix transcriptional regulator [Roseomonas marmotae]|uniref:MarR family transcriptional regulator n=1 Tax=Roseomonas marmotae TaxID=2768161 RepID=A0ABS3KAX2_9PROT|nr:MarR family transcriptional regulator [Roseomonas marmotae]MBO1074603.1 MarR family transcriptional regulator [Roseomonas marmotae]QTI81629.1 MarR family transcriptional regulator [Roseomonas marmotae]
MFRSKSAVEPLILQDFLPYRLSVVTEEVSSLFATRYQERFGLSIPEWRVVAVVGQHGTLSTQQVIEHTAMDRVRVSRAVIRLADKALLERRSHPKDQRAQILQLSRQGRAVYGEIVPLARELQAALSAALTEAEQRQLGVILDKIGRRTRKIARADKEHSMTGEEEA